MHQTRTSSRTNALLAGGLLVALLGFAMCATGSAVSSGTPSLTILYTSQATGQIRSCNCTKFRYGGYGREATLVSDLRKSSPNLILIEGGDMVGRPNIDQDRLKADVAIRALDTIGYTALVPGEGEANFGRANLDKLKASSKTPFVLANARYKSTGKPICQKPYQIHKTPSGMRVALIGLLGPEVLPALGDTDVEADDPASALKQIVPKVRAASDLVVVIAHMLPDKAKAIAQTGGADVVICTHSLQTPHIPAKDTNTVDAPAEKIGNCILVESGSRSGWNVGRLDLELDGKKIRNLSNRLYFLDRAYEEDAAVVKIYDDYNKQVRTLVSKQQQEMKKQFLDLMKKRGFDMSKRTRPKVYAGAESCKACHQSAHEAWAKSRHATAFASLEKTKQGFDPECVGCHTTGGTQRGGFVDKDTTPDLLNVQCESCHGPGVAHAAKPAPGYGALEEDICRGCHTEAFNPEFDYDEMWKAIAHTK